MTSALVPPSPSADTAPRRGPDSGASQSSPSVTNRNGVFSNVNRGCGVSTPMLAGRWAVRSASTVLIRARTPPACSSAPVLDFKQLIAQGGCRLSVRASACAAAWTSKGSAKLLAPPLISRCPIELPLTDAAVSASSKRARWTSAFGALTPSDRPSWLTAVPRMTARTWSPSA